MVRKMIKKLEKHCDEDRHGTYTCDYDLTEIGDKINEILEVLNNINVLFYLRDN